MAEWASMFDDRWEVTPPLADEAFGHIPAKRGVLLLADATDRPITMITAGDLRARLRTRLADNDTDRPRRRADLRHITRTVLWTLTDSHFETDWAFLELARAVWPQRYATMLAWKRPWFVHVDCDEAFPHFVRSRDVQAGPGRYVGPFPSGRWAEQFIQGLQDAFDLCRDIKCLRTSPNGPPCSYGQMGRCLSPCDGKTSMDAYRQVVGRAADFAAGSRREFQEDLQRRMSTASEDLAFERAAMLKTKLHRLEAFDRSEYMFAAPAEAFRYLLIQRGPNAHTAKTFFVNGAAISAGPELAYPLVDNALADALRQMSALVARAPTSDEAGAWRIGLVGRYLFSGADRRGVILPWREALTAAEIAEAIETAVDSLKLRAPKRRKRASSSQAQPGK